MEHVRPPSAKILNIEILAVLEQAIEYESHG